MEKWEKSSDKQSPEFITYYHFSKDEHFVFCIQVDLGTGDVLTVTKVHKMINHNGSPWYVNDQSGNITKEEFEMALDKTLKFLKQH